MENYVNRLTGFPAGIYQQPLDQFAEPYVVPQENGNRTDVRWMYLKDSSKSSGLLIVADSLLSMSAWPYSEQNTVQEKHAIDLVDAGYLTLNVDLKRMGVGGSDSRDPLSEPLPQYRIPSRSCRYGFYLVSMEGPNKDTGEPDAEIQQIWTSIKTGGQIR